VGAQYMSIAEAKAWGAIALFGETYDETVRVVEIGGPWSRELCGGTHVEHSSQVGMVALSSEGSVGSGSRRIEAFVGIEAFQQLAAERALVAELTSALKVQPADLVPRIERLLARLAETEKRLASFQLRATLDTAGDIAAGATEVAGVRVVAYHSPEAQDGEGARALALDVRARLGDDAPAVVAIATIAADKSVVIVATNERARAAGLAAGDLVKTASKVLGGGGGGGADLAQGGGQDSGKIKDALAAVISAVEAHG
jgi:alanyl-tRNA synthetase